MYFNLCSAACGLRVCEGGGGCNGNNYECPLPTSVLTESDLTVISMHGTEQTPTNPKLNVSVIA